jgi:glycosyltransferase involved in cell wall biosynthesis
VAAPAAAEAAYTFEGMPVRRFATGLGAPTPSALYGAFDQTAADSFARVLDEERPDVLHQHALTYACSVELMRSAKQRGVPVVFTYHTPTTTCQRGTLLHRGTRVCDGRLDPARCTPCTLHGLGVPHLAGRVINCLPDGCGRWLKSHGISGRVSTALTIPGAMRARIAMLQEFLQLPDRFVALTPWVSDLLQTNGVPLERITVSGHGVDGSARKQRATRPPGPLSIAYLGRLDPVKGTDLLVRAVRQVSAPVRLDVFGILQGPADGQRLAQLRDLARGDLRIRFLAPLEPRGVVEALAAYDLVAVPSQWLETGPLVVLEAHVAGVPVVGSALGGIAEKVQDGVDGVLVAPHGSVTAWSRALERLAVDPSRVARLQRGVRAPRPMSLAASEMRAVYSAVAPAAGAFRTAV